MPRQSLKIRRLKSVTVYAIEKRTGKQTMIRTAPSTRRSFIGRFSLAIAMAVISAPTILLLSSQADAQISLTGDYSPTYNGTDDPWIVDGSLNIGIIANGTMNVAGGSEVNAGQTLLGLDSGGEGVATLTGGGSMLTATGFVIGKNGTGRLNVLNGAKVESDFSSDVASEDDGIGELTISGVGSTFNSELDLDIGDRGTGTLTVADGGQLSVRNFRIGDKSSGLVTGNGSLISTTSRFTVGADSNGTFSGQVGQLRIELGGKVHVAGDRGVIGVAFNAGSVVVTGVGSRWDNDNDLYVGGVFGNGTLVVEDGATVTSNRASISVNGAGVATVTGSGSTFVSETILYVGLQGSGTLNVFDEGRATNTDGFLGISANGSGFANVSGAGAVWENSNNLQIGSESVGIRGDGTLTIQQGGVVKVENLLKLESKGIINLEGGRLEAQTLDITADGSELNLLGGTLDVENLVGDLTQNGGALAPGNSPGAMEISDNYILNSGSIEIEVAGVGQGTDYDFVGVLGTTILNGGNLNVSFLDDFQESISELDSFTVLTAQGGLSGLFDGIADNDRVMTKDGIGSFQVNYIGNSVVLSGFAIAEIIILGDVNQDGAVNFLDISPFIEILSTSTYLEEADCNEDGVVNFLDIDPFIDVLSGN